jgi:calcineurin-like phosphoesterase family protein
VLRLAATLAATAVAAGALAAPSSAADPVLAAAGDIACAPQTPKTPTSCHQAETAAIVGAINPTAVAVLGDNQYETGFLPYYQQVFDATWGQFRSKTFPVPGNHEYNRVGADGYYTYFGSAAGDPTRGYYAYNLGRWHILALNSNCTYVPCNAGSAQEQFVRREVAGRRRGCIMAYWHHSLFSSQGGDPRMRDIWRDLTDARVDVVLSGHNHNYERFPGQDADGNLNPFAGPREFVVGTGGRSLGRIRRVRPTSEAHDDRVFGVLALYLGSNGYAWSFDSEGGVYSDTGAADCHDRIPPTLRLATLRPATFKAAPRGRFITPDAVPTKSGGTVLRFGLSEPSTVTFVVQRPGPGRRARDTCVPARRRPAGSQGCTYWAPVTSNVTRTLRGGHNRLVLSGRFGGRRLAPGAYRLLTTLVDVAQNPGRPVAMGFQIVR